MLRKGIFIGAVMRLTLLAALACSGQTAPPDKPMGPLPICPAGESCTVFNKFVIEQCTPEPCGGVPIPEKFQLAIDNLLGEMNTLREIIASLERELALKDEQITILKKGNNLLGSPTFDTLWAWTSGRTSKLSGNSGGRL